MNPINPYSGPIAGIPTADTRSNTDKAVSGSAADSGKSSGQALAASSVAQDHLTLSPQARQLMAAQKTSMGNTDQLARIKAAISNGTYQISPLKIGQGLTQDNQQFMPASSNKSA
ncbi:flagellar biosynthesis anti-sigma factor FlgM [Acidithiobacillus concretivorus]|uniref:Negative regulator of flagellin synthesis n=1 Tax=Acidithiobacillus concretivorus TaxID=3063952 RepID=A0ABS5ZMW6_9PROT|nr:flagellar biosynthesis anti-sigma factor FlgM [Acidithiobacillus concretivorus]MBU2737996.1 flagellar biosynthesis anti-sigma factor FlgM [Acidithiobacillus concretivorus]